ncbi:MAG: NAD(P)H-dependent oxidoreductase [Roseivirga sp.]|nr:NAD(P)H-dependent oxidoreductase [Roseivirga sp.]
MNILAFGASSSSTSINQKLAVYTAQQIENSTVTVADLNDFEMPIYSSDREKAGGIPQLASQFKNLITQADGIVISFAEHNGSYTAAFKNLYDWVSRLEGKVWQGKPVLLMATSPGGRGGQTVLKQAVVSFPFMGADVASEFSLPSFHKNFDSESGITDQTLKVQFEEALQAFKVTLPINLTH